jgi:hypothetical protein
MRSEPFILSFNDPFWLPHIHSAAVTMMQLFLAFLALYFAPAAAFGGKL